MPDTTHDAAHTARSEQSEVKALAPIKVVDADTGAYLCEFMPAAGLLKLRLRDRLFIIDIERLAMLYSKGFRAVKSTAVVQDRPFMEEPKSK